MTPRHPSSPLHPAAPRAHPHWMLALALGVASAGQMACATAGQSAPPRANAQPAGGEAESSAAEEPGDAMGPSYSGGGGGEGGVAPSVAGASDEASAEDPFSTLVRTERQYSALMDAEGAPDCAQAERLVQRICLLAARVCSLDDGEGEADCDDAQGRCQGAEGRLRRACGGGR